MQHEMTPDIRTPREKVEQDIYEFTRLVEDANIEYVGKDHEYVPDSPEIRKDHPNAETGD